MYSPYQPGNSALVHTTTPFGNKWKQMIAPVRKIYDNYGFQTKILA
jgi:hypothetical protein